MKSKYSPGKTITKLQYVVEIVCERRAKSYNLDLQDQFWKKKEWRKYFTYQIILANRLAQEYGEDAVLKAVMHFDCKNITSLRDKRVRPTIKKVIGSYKIPEKRIEVSESSNNKGRPYTGNSLLDKLDG